MASYSTYTLFFLKSLYSPLQKPSPTMPSSSFQIGIGKCGRGRGEGRHFRHFPLAGGFPIKLRGDGKEIQGAYIYIYIHPDGDPNTFYQTPRKLKGKYASEGYFIQNIRQSRFRTEDPDENDLFFIPISSDKMPGKARDLALDKICGKGTSYEDMTTIVQNSAEGLISKHPYWNRTLAADHFLVTCHDVGVRAMEGLPLILKNSIQVVCSPSYDVGFIPHKDVALPQVLQLFALPAGRNDVENRTILGFWAGHLNLKIRFILARVWENDTELHVLNNRINRATGSLMYQKRFYKTKYCVCPSGSQCSHN